MDKPIRVRFAPSPTGYLHVGSLRTALYNYLFARKHGGAFVLRIEDTDRTRFVPGAVESLIGSLRKFGLDYDEGPRIATQGEGDDGRTYAAEEYSDLHETGGYGPYVQSERADIYQTYAEKLLEKGHAYRCFCTAERLETMRAEQTAAKQAPRYDRHCLGLSADEVHRNLEAGTPHVIRLKVESGEEVAFDDLVRGRVSFRTDNIDDQVLMKSDGFPTYHLAVVVDDHLMDITHIIRGEEWLPSTPKHLLLYRALGWEAPAYAHIPLLLNPDRSKLSKRQGDVAVEDYLAKGYLPDALINFVALLGWNPGEGDTREIFSLDELVDGFDLEHVHKAGAVFDIKKLDWLNAQYVRRLTLDGLYDRSLLFLESKDFYRGASAACRDREFVRKMLAVEQERLVRLDEAGEGNRYLFGLPDYDAALLRWKDNDDTATQAALGRARDLLTGLPEEEWRSRERLGTILLETAGEKRGDFLWPLRVALSGSRQSPPPGDLTWILGRAESLKRLSFALGKFEK